MPNRLLKTGAALFFISIPAIALSQQTRTFNQNASRSNHTRLSLSVTPVFSNPVQSKNDTLLFRGQGAGLQLGIDYRLGKIGIGLLSGFGSSAYDESSIQQFQQRLGLQPDQVTIQKSRQQQAYLLVGPSVTIGNTVELTAHVKGGVFFNNAGNMQLQRKGAQRAEYHIAATEQQLRPGFLAGLRFNYPIAGGQWAIGLAADYLQTSSNLFQSDARRAEATPFALKANIKDVLAGISITYNLRQDRDAASGLATGKRSSGPRDAASGLATGRRQHSPVVNPENENTNNSCGPVVQKMTFTDGTVQEMTFACPADALAYQREQPGSAPQLRAQNNNTVRSNRTELKSILAEADTDGDGVYETDVTAEVYDDIIIEAGTRVADHNSSRSNKSASVADHNSSRSNKSASVADHNSSRSNKTASIKPDDGADPTDEAMRQKAGISTSRSNVRTRSSIESLTEDIYIAYGTATINGTETAVKVVYKTKHDTAKNSINNVR